MDHYNTPFATDLKYKVVLMVESVACLVPKHSMQS